LGCAELDSSSDRIMDTLLDWQGPLDKLDGLTQKAAFVSMAC
jgi:hypothetical protein